jgi:hypothetical protein
VPPWRISTWDLEENRVAQCKPERLMMTEHRMKVDGFRNGRALRALWAIEEKCQVRICRNRSRAWRTRFRVILEALPGGKVPVLVDGAPISKTGSTSE